MSRQRIERAKQAIELRTNVECTVSANSPSCTKEPSPCLDKGIEREASQSAQSKLGLGQGQASKLTVKFSFREDSFFRFQQCCVKSNLVFIN